MVWFTFTTFNLGNGHPAFKLLKVSVFATASLSLTPTSMGLSFSDTANGFSFHPTLPLAACSSGHRRFSSLDDSEEFLKLKGTDHIFREKYVHFVFL